MKVLHVIPSVSPLRGGPSLAVLGMVRALRRVGCDAEIACTDDDGPGRLDVPLDGPTEWEGVPIRFFPRFSPGLAALREFQYSAPLGRWLRGKLGHYDLVHVHAVFSYASTHAMHLARRLGKPYLVRPIGQLSAWSLRQKAAKKALYLALVERKNLRGAAGIHCTSEAERRDVLAFDAGLPTFVSPIGVDVGSPVAKGLDAVAKGLHPSAGGAPKPEGASLRRGGDRVAKGLRPSAGEGGAAREAVLRRFGLRGGDFVVLYLGRLHPKKGLDVLLDAVAGLPGVALVIAGSGDARYEERLRQRAAAPGFGGRVHFAGFVSGAEKEMLLRGADVFALPSEHENFGIAVLEALMGGLPVVVSPGVALEDFVRQIGAGVVVEPRAEEVAAALRCLVAGGPATAEERDRIRREAAGAYAWDGIAGGLLATYGEILARGRGGAGIWNREFTRMNTNGRAS